MESIPFDNEATSAVNVVSVGKENTHMATKDTFMEEVKTYTSFKIASFIDTYWFFVLVPIGLVGNTLSFLVMIRPNNRKMSTCIYMATISITDNLMMGLCLHTLLVVVLKIHGWHLMECKVVVFFGLIALQNSTFQVLAMTIDKYIAIKWPHKAATYSTPSRAKMIAVGLFIWTLIYNSPHLFLSNVFGLQCFAYDINSLITRVYSWFSFVLNAVIPFTLLIYMNCIIVKTVQQSCKMFRNNDNTTSTAGNKGIETRQKTLKSAENQLTTMLLLVTTLFLILLCPTYIRFIYLAFVQMDTPLKYANSMFFYQISFKLYTTNSGIIFLLYCISRQKFRNDLKEILCCLSLSKNGMSKSKGRDQTNVTETSSACS